MPFVQQSTCAGDESRHGEVFFCLILCEHRFKGGIFTIFYAFPRGLTRPPPPPPLLGTLSLFTLLLLAPAEHRTGLLFR